MEKSKPKQRLVTVDIGHLSPKNAALALRFMKDLVAGLDKVEDYQHGVSVFGSARISSGSKYYRAAYRLGHALARDCYVVVTGGGPGIMEAANKGASEAGGRTLGLNIHLPDEQKINNYVTDFISFRYFFARKVMLAFAAKTYVFFPGGIGTLDEVTELLTLMTTKKIATAPVILFGKNYWKYFNKFLIEQMLLKYQMVDSDIGKIFHITDDIDDVINIVNMADKISSDHNAKEYLEQLLRK